MGTWFRNLRESALNKENKEDDDIDTDEDNDKGDEVEEDTNINKKKNIIDTYKEIKADEEYRREIKRINEHFDKRREERKKQRLRAARKLPDNTLKRYVLLVLFYADKLPLSITEVIQLIESLYSVKYIVITRMKYTKRGYHWYIALYLNNASRYTVKDKLEELFKGRCDSDGVNVLGGDNDKNVYVCTYYRSFGTMLEFITEYGISKYLYKITEEEFIRYLERSQQKKKQNLVIHNRVKVEIRGYLGG